VAAMNDLYVQERRLWVTCFLWIPKTSSDLKTQCRTAQAVHSKEGAAHIHRDARRMPNRSDEVQSMPPQSIP